MKTRRSNIKTLIGLLIVVVLVNVLASHYFKRFDLTENHRYTLSEPAKNIIKDIDKPVLVQVFLKGDFPSDFRRLQNETRYLLEEFTAYNPNIKFQFVNPLEESNLEAEKVGERFFSAGMAPQRLTIKKNGENSQSLLFPWAIASTGTKSVKIPLIVKSPDDSNEELVNNSVQELEYGFANGFKQLTTKKSKKIAVMRGNGELSNLHLGSFLKAIGVYYHVAPFTLDSVAENPEKTLKQLEDYNLIVEAKPTKPFTEKEKFVLDQYLMNGGKALWFVDAVAAEKDSLFISSTGNMLAYPRDLNLTDFFFKYGVRINPSLVNDLHADNIILASGKGKQTQFKPYPWYFSPLVVSESDNPIVHNIDGIRFDFASPMDTLKNGIKKTVLLKSSLATKVEGTPREISLRGIGQKPDFKTYRNGKQILAVLLEGQFTSVYKNRVKPFALKDTKDESKPTKMIVVSDGDVIKNKIEKGQPIPLDYDRRTGKTYGNKEFLLNSVNYLLDDSGLLDIRTKKVAIPFLSPEKIQKDKTFWQIIDIGLPLVLLALFGFGFTLYRRRKYRN